MPAIVTFFDSQRVIVPLRSTRQRLQMGYRRGHVYSLCSRSMQLGSPRNKGTRPSTLATDGQSTSKYERRSRSRYMVRTVIPTPDAPAVRSALYPGEDGQDACSIRQHATLSDQSSWHAGEGQERDRD